nr:MAG TPA: hypothetical protein [Caudoviricetes sp.]
MPAGHRFIPVIQIMLKDLIVSRTSFSIQNIDLSH